MKLPWTQRGELSELEHRLRDERPRPSDEVVEQVSRQTSGSRASAPRFRLGMAGAVSGVALAAVVALGGLGAPMDTAARIGQFDTSSSASKPGNGKPAKVQYEEKVTICHRPPGNPSNGQTLTLPRSGAQAHLREHRTDSAGPCPPPPPPKPAPKPKPKR